jgi:hypothetical protein
MKTLPKRVLLIISILLIISSCEKEETDPEITTETSNGQHLSNVTSKDIPQVIGFLEQDGKSGLNFLLDRGESCDNKSSSNLVLTSAELNNIKKLTNSQGISNYTFQLNFDNYQNLDGYTSYFNLVVKELSTGDYYSYIQEFRVDNTWLLSNSLQTNMHHYNGFMVVYNTVGEFLITIELNNGNVVNKEETDKCDSGDGSGSSGGGGSAEGSGPPGGPGPGGSGSGSGFSGGGLSSGWLCNWRGSFHANPSDCNEPSEGGTWVISIKSLLPEGKGTHLLKNGCLPLPEECFSDVQDPCECDGNGGCVEENDEVPVNFPINIALVFELNSLLDQNLTPEQIDALASYGNEFFQSMIDFLNANDTPEAQGFIEEAIKAKINNGDIDLPNRLIYNPLEAQNYRNRMSPAEIEIFDNLNILQKEGYLRAATQAYIYSETHFPNPVRNRLGDVFKHTFWNALSTVYIGEELTLQLTTAHEEIDYDPDYPNHYKETQMDLYNNSKGRQVAYGAGRLYELVNEGMNNGELRYLDNLVYINGFWNASETSNLIPTNQ